MKSMPASSAMRTGARLSSQVPDQRSGTLVTARPDEQLAPNSPIFRRLPPSSIRRCGNDEFAFGTAIPLGSSRADLYGGTISNANTKTMAGDEGGLSMLTIMRAPALLATLLASLLA